jgi:hypothetical protein
MLVHLLGRPGEFVYIRLIMLVHLLGYALWGPAHLFTYVYLCWCICWDMHCEARRLCLHTSEQTKTMSSISALKYDVVFQMVVWQVSGSGWEVGGK